MTAEELLSKVTFVAASLDDVPHDHLRSTLEAEHIVRLRGLFSRDALRQVMLGIASRFDPDEDRKHDPRDVEVPRTNLLPQRTVRSATGSRRLRHRRWLLVVHAAAPVSPRRRVQGAASRPVCGGRVAAFASLYRHLVEGTAGYEALTRRSAQRFGDDGPPPGT